MVCIACVAVRPRRRSSNAGQIFVSAELNLISWVHAANHKRLFHLTSSTLCVWHQTGASFVHGVFLKPACAVAAYVYAWSGYWQQTVLKVYGYICCPDNIGARLLRKLSEQTASPLTTIFQQSLHDGIVPVDWRKANITPVFKKGQKYLCSNYYRPISLTCVVSKLMEHVVCSSIMNRANMHNILYSLQHGFRARRSCETQLINLVNDIANNMQSGLQTGEWVPREALFVKLLWPLVL